MSRIRVISPRGVILDTDVRLLVAQMQLRGDMYFVGYPYTIETTVTGPMHTDVIEEILVERLEEEIG